MPLNDPLTVEATKNFNFTRHMNLLVSLVPIVLQLLPTLTTGVQETITWINNIRTSLKQTGEWTDAMETAYQASLLATTKDPAYQPDPAGPEAGAAPVAAS